MAHSKKMRDASRAPYDHAKYIASRRIIMQDWADIIDDFRARKRFSEIAEKYGPMSERGRAQLNVIEREDQ